MLFFKVCRPTSQPVATLHVKDHSGHEVDAVTLMASPSARKMTWWCTFGWFDEQTFPAKGCNCPFAPARSRMVTSFERVLDRTLSDPSCVTVQQRSRRLIWPCNFKRLDAAHWLLYPPFIFVQCGRSHVWTDLAKQSWAIFIRAESFHNGVVPAGPPHCPRKFITCLNDTQSCQLVELRCSADPIRKGDNDRRTWLRPHHWKAFGGVFDCVSWQEIAGTRSGMP
jgi:hypothetical protein